VLGKASSQGDLFSCDQLYSDHVGRESIYAFLAKVSGTYFRDEDFAALFCSNNGRPSVPPSKLCVALILQTLDGVSDQEAIARSAFDIRWKVALSLEVEGRLCAKSTLQLFRAKLILHEQYGQIFAKSVEACRQAGLLKKEKLIVAIDTTPIFGRGAVKDTFNLISDQIRRVVEQVVAVTNCDRDGLICQHGLSRHFGASFKGAVDLDWSDDAQRRALVGQLVADARVATELGRAVLRSHGSPDIRPLRESCDLLAALVLQDIDEKPDDNGGPKIRQGTSKDRVISTTDTDMRHGRKSASEAFDGHKATVVADVNAGVIVATTVSPGNEVDGASARVALEAAQQQVGGQIERAIGDTAYGTHTAREAVKDVVPELIAKSPPVGQKPGCFSITDFSIDPVSDVATCPAGKQSAKGSPVHRAPGPGTRYAFARSDCAECPLRARCTTAEKGPRTLTVTVVTQAQQQHRMDQQTPHFRAAYRPRVTVEHRIARLVQLGIRQARYIGRRKVAFQVAMAATVANLVAAILAAGPAIAGLMRRVCATLVALHMRGARLDLRPVSIVWEFACAAVVSRFGRPTGHLALAPRNAGSRPDL
jgi:transposase